MSTKPQVCIVGGGMKRTVLVSDLQMANMLSVSMDRSVSVRLFLSIGRRSFFSAAHGLLFEVFGGRPQGRFPLLWGRKNRVFLGE